MMLFAHTGITLGIALLPQQALRRFKSAPDEASEVTSADGSSIRFRRLAFLTSPPDYRLVLLGSMLPDIIDKPLGTWLLLDSLSSGRIYAHTLLFSSVLFAIGILFYRSRGWTGGMWLGIGSLVHVALDQIWRAPSTLFWPAYGWSFPVDNTEGWVKAVFVNMFEDPTVYVPEIIGFLVLSTFFVHLVRRRILVHLLKTGAAA